MSPHSVLVVFAALIVPQLAAPTTFGEETGVGNYNVRRLGVRGISKRGHWAELEIEVKAGNQSLDVTWVVASQDGDGVPVEYVGEPIRLEPGQTATYRTLYKVGPPRSPLSVRIRSRESGRLLAELSASKEVEETYSSTSHLVAVLGKSAVFEQAVKLLPKGRGEESIAFELSSAESLPLHFRGYDAIDSLIVTMDEASLLQDASKEQIAAIAGWVRSGGRLVLIAGQASEALLGKHPELRDLLPGKVIGWEPMASGAGLSTFTAENLNLDAFSEQNRPTALRVEADRQAIVLSETGSGAADRPLVTEAPFRIGRVTWILFDVNQPAFANWSGQTRFLARILSGKPLSFDTQEKAAGGQMTHLGYRDLEGQLRATLDQYEGVTAIHFYWAAGALAVYLLLLGGEYFLLRKVAPLFMHVTWGILLLLISGTTAGILFVGGGLRGDQIRLNHVEIVEVDGAGNERGIFWSGLYSPHAGEFDLKMERVQSHERPSNHNRLELAWQALPGEGLGGVDGPAIAAAFDQPYLVELAEGPQKGMLVNLPITMASSKMLAGNWWRSRSGTHDLPKSDLRRGRIRDLEGSFVNPVPVVLKNAYLAHNEMLYRSTQEMAPGALINVDRLDRKHLESYFTERRLLGKENMSSPWNQEDADVTRILQIMMFHDACGGKRYTQLSQRYHPEMDLSFLIKHGYAVLVGRSEKPLLELTNHGEPIDPASVQRWTYYISIFPVAPATEAQRAE